jgi:SET domain-containing protein
MIIFDKSMDDQIKIVRLYLPLHSVYRNFKVRIAQSNINGAGKGVFAVDKIPAGSIGIYKGKKYKSENRINELYTWQIYKFDKLTGEVSKDGSTLYYLDAHDERYANWTRYVNCGMKKTDNNMIAEQSFHNVNYVALRDINSGEELYIDYGQDYRKYHLNMEDNEY